MPKRDPHDVLGVPRDASQATVKAAWRRLAREHHPDLAQSPGAAEAATRKMAEINRAYEQLRAASRGAEAVAAAGRRTQWPPPERPTRPVTGRVDTTATFRPRNTTTGPRAQRTPPPLAREDRLRREPLRASTPTGPMARGRQRNFRPPEPPSLDEALNLTIEFGKFHGHTLGQIAGFEPTYIEWLAKTISRDPDLVAAARVLLAELEARAAARRPHAARA
ncbi:MAG TPA: J domain-containing protein [Candidatus Acidoferrales bacterium]|nr:J domain-containing protein [Candidatus Acidoferrales bacterium]